PPTSDDERLARARPGRGGPASFIFLVGPFLPVTAIVVVPVTAATAVPIVAPVASTEIDAEARTAAVVRIISVVVVLILRHIWPRRAHPDPMMVVPSPALWRARWMGRCR